MPRHEGYVVNLGISANSGWPQETDICGEGCVCVLVGNGEKYGKIYTEMRLRR